jgi:uncharacterized lipoprotein YehR (DUF1307 family)
MKLPITKKELKELREQNKRGIIFNIDYAISGEEHTILYTYTNDHVLSGLTNKKWLKQNSILITMDNKEEILKFIETKKHEFPQANHRLINSIEE